MTDLGALAVHRMDAERLTDVAALVLTLAVVAAISAGNFDPMPRLLTPPEPSSITLSFEAASAPAATAPAPLVPQPVAPPRPMVTDEPPIEAFKPRQRKLPPPKPLVPQKAVVAQPNPSAEQTSANAVPSSHAEASSEAVAATPPADPAAGDEAAYIAELRAYLDSIKRYPTSKEARLLHPQGAVGVRFVLDRNGEVSDVVVARTSNSLILDQEAWATVRGGTFKKIPETAWVGESRHVFTVTIQFTPHN